MRKRTAGLLICVLLIVLGVSLWKAVQNQRSTAQSGTCVYQPGRETGTVENGQMECEQAGVMLLKLGSGTVWNQQRVQEKCQSLLSKLLVGAVLLPLCITTSLLAAIHIRKK